MHMVLPIHGSMMGFLKRLAVVSLFLAIGAYWLTSPIPDGYSFQSGMELRKTNALLKVYGLVTCVSQVFESTYYINVSRSAEIDMQPNSEADTGVAIEAAVFNTVPVKIYRPLNQKTRQPGFVYYHGGGWVLGSVASYHAFVLRLCQQTNAVFVSVDYRLAPEHLYPTAFEDSLAATKYFLLHAEKYGVDPHRIAIGGDSAGGNLAAAVALKLRDENFEPKVKMQVLIYPVVQSIDYQLPSMIQNADGPVLSCRAMALFASFYVDGSSSLQQLLLDDTLVPSSVKRQLAGTHLNVKNLKKKYLVGYARPIVEKEVDEKLWDDIKDTMLNPYLSPLLADDVCCLPMSYVFTCEHDVLRDEGMLYAYRLKEAGNDVKHAHSNTGFHGVMSLGIRMPEAAAMIADMTKYIADNL